MRIFDYLVDNIYETVYAYEATDPSDLSFDVGERIVVLKHDGEWWTGQIGERTGVFPSNYVQKINNSEEIAIATAPFESTEAGQLTFEKDQIIHVTKKNENGWYQGEIRVSNLLSLTQSLFFLFLQQAS